MSYLGLRVRRDRDDCYLTGFRTVVPKHPKGGRRFVFRVRLEDLLTLWTYKVRVLVRMEARVAKVGT